MSVSVTPYSSQQISMRQCFPGGSVAGDTDGDPLCRSRKSFVASVLPAQNQAPTLLATGTEHCAARELFVGTPVDRTS